MVYGERKHFSLRCMFGFHIHANVTMNTQMGMGFFGGPITTFHWNCPRCGRKGMT